MSSGSKHPRYISVSVAEVSHSIHVLQSLRLENTLTYVLVLTVIQNKTIVIGVNKERLCMFISLFVYTV
jgi:hypothetical protein